MTPPGEHQPTDGHREDDGDDDSAESVALLAPVTHGRSRLGLGAEDPIPGQAELPQVDVGWHDGLPGIVHVGTVDPQDEGSSGVDPAVGPCLCEALVAGVQHQSEGGSLPFEVGPVGLSTGHPPDMAALAVGRRDGQVVGVDSTDRGVVAGTDQHRGSALVVPADGVPDSGLPRTPTEQGSRDEAQDEEDASPHEAIETRAPSGGRSVLGTPSRCASLPGGAD